MAAQIPLETGHTCMNHFLLLDLRGAAFLTKMQLADIAEKVCSAALADDLLVIDDSEQADVRLRIFGGDRREADFCGNGMIYTAAKIGAELQRDDITIESAAGIKQATRQDNQWQVEVGAAVKLEEDLRVIQTSFLENNHVYGLLRAGEPHLVLYRPNVFPGFHINRKDFEMFCRPLRDITAIDGGISITVVFQVEFRSVLIRTFERGVRRQTYSCGTGSVSATAAVFNTPQNGTAFHVCAPGGMHDVLYDNDRWYINATPQRIASGYLEDGIMHFPFDGLFSYQ